MFGCVMDGTLVVSLFTQVSCFTCTSRIIVAKLVHWKILWIAFVPNAGFEFALWKAPALFWNLLLLTVKQADKGEQIYDSLNWWKWYLEDYLWGLCCALRRVVDTVYSVFPPKEIHSSIQRVHVKPLLSDGNFS